MSNTHRLSPWGQVYVTVVVALGATTILYSAYELHAHPIGWNWFVLALLTLLSGSATVRLASVPATVSISETFVITSVLLFGPAAGTLTVTLDALVICLWLARRGHPSYRIAFNIFALPASLWVSAELFFRVAGVQPLGFTTTTVQISDLLLPLFLFTAVYFGLNSWLIAIAISFETRRSPLPIWRRNFAWLSLSYFGGASVAALLVTYTRHLDYTYAAFYTYIAFTLPLLAILYFTFSTAMGRVADTNAHLCQLNTLYMATIETLAMAIDAKDQITHGHIRRVQAYAVGLAKALGVTDEAQINAIEAASLLHDMGKLAVPEYILNKPGPLTPAEFERMKSHASVGADILSAIEFPYPVVPIVRHHHENWNGTGYPSGLAGTDIPIGARILSVVDCFDALTSDRPYRPRLTDRDAIQILMDRRGTMYDPLIVDTFIRVHSHIVPVDRPSRLTPSLSAITNAAEPPSEDTHSDRRLDEISASTDEMLTLFDLAKSLGPGMDPSDVADIITKHIRRLIPCSLSVFYLFDSDADELVATHIAGEPSALIGGLRIPRGQRLSGWVAANRQTIRNSDPVLDFGESARAMSPRPRSCLSTALVHNDTLVGVLTLYSTNRNGFSADHERVVEIVATQVAGVVHHACESHNARTSSFRDRLTGLPTFEQFVAFSRAAEGATDASTPAVLVLFRVSDRQDTSNEAGGTTVDSTLNNVLLAIRRILRPTDMLFLYEQGQFIAVLLHTDEGTAKSVANRIADNILSFGRRTAVGLQVAVSLAVMPRDGHSFEALLHVASRWQSGPTRGDKSPTEDRIH